MAKDKRFKSLKLSDLFAPGDLPAIMKEAKPKPKRKLVSSDQRFRFTPKKIISFMLEYKCTKCGYAYEPVPKYAETSTFVLGRLGKQLFPGFWISCNHYRPYQGGHEELEHTTRIELHRVKQCPHCFTHRITAPAPGSFSELLSPLAVTNGADRHIKEPQWTSEK